MTKKFSFYCWMKVAPPPPKPPSPVLSGGLPPKKTSKVKQQGVQAELWTGVIGFWNEPLAAAYGLDYGEAFNEEKDAKDWIKTNDGTTWAANAVSYSLAMFDIEVK